MTNNAEKEYERLGIQSIPRHSPSSWGTLQAHEIIGPQDAEAALPKKARGNTDTGKYLQFRKEWRGQTNNKFWSSTKASFREDNHRNLACLVNLLCQVYTFNW